MPTATAERTWVCRQLYESTCSGYCLHRRINNTINRRGGKVGEVELG